jgi:hypothetical protein
MPGNSGYFTSSAKGRAPLRRSKLSEAINPNSGLGPVHTGGDAYWQVDVGTNFTLSSTVRCKNL